MLGGFVMKKFISLTALLLCLVMIFASCGSEGTLKFSSDKISESQLPKNHAVSEIAVGDGFTLDHSRNSLAIFSKTNTDPDSTAFKAINLKTGATILEKTFSADDILNGNSSIKIADNGAFIIIYENKNYSVLKADGTTLSSSQTAPYFINDSILIGENLYRYDLKTFEIKETSSYLSLNGDIPECEPSSYKFSDYYVKMSTTGFTVYDSHYKYIGTYNYPGYAKGTNAFILKDGNILVQYIDILPNDSSEYEVFAEGDKANIIHKIIKSSDLSEKELDLDIFIKSIDAVDLDDEGLNYFKKDITNTAEIYKIEDKRIDSSQSYYVSLNEKNGNYTYIFDKRFTRILPIGNGYLFAKATDGNQYILDKKVNIITKANGVDIVTEKYLLTQNAIYAFATDGKSDPTKIQDLKNGLVEYQYEDFVGSNIILSSADENGNKDYYLFDGTFTKIVDYSENQRFLDLNIAGIYAVKTTSEGSTTTKLYKSDKSEFASYTGNVTQSTTYYENKTSIYLLKVDTKYYKITVTY